MANSTDGPSQSEAKMRIEGQPITDSKSPAKLAGRWPPSLPRLVLGALLAAGLGYIVLKTIYPIFVVPVEFAAIPETAPPELHERLEKAQVVVDGKNFSVVFGIIGAILGASSVAFSFGVQSVKTILVATVGSAVMGVLGANLSNWMFSNFREGEGKDILIMGVTLDGMAQTIVGYALLWGLIGLGVGLGVGSVRSVGKSLVAGISGLCGGILGAMLYVILTAQFSIGTLMNSVLPYSNSNQAIWLVLFTVLIAICIAMGSGERRRNAAA